MKLVALAGGVGASRFLEGLVRTVPEKGITVIVNTGDDIELHGLHISPDIDIVMYTLAGIVDKEKGWGIQGDTFHCLEILERYGLETWFKLGDKDLATHIYRTRLLNSGIKLSEITKKLCESLGLKLSILPMTNERFETRVLTDKGDMHFQEYLVKRGAQDKVLGVYFEGVDKAEPTPGIIDSLLGADAVIICPSNPIVSIGTILSVKGIRETLRETKAKRIGISPIVGGAPIKGPADKLMEGLGIEVSAHGVASFYKDFLDAFVIDVMDRAEAKKIESLGIQVKVTNTIMKNLKDKIQLAKTVVGLIR
ncbi:MAG: 2-phospho-L-lactate transferase [Candidatus Bathyarchaeia archaeon]